MRFYVNSSFLLVSSLNGLTGLLLKNTDGIQLRVLEKELET